MVKFCRYFPNKPDKFIEGFELAQSLTSNTGSLLYAKDTRLSLMHITRLLKVHESNRNMNFDFRIKKTDKLIQAFRLDITERILKFFKHWRETKIFRSIVNTIGEKIEVIIQKLLNDDDIMFALLKMILICESSKLKNSLFYPKHPLMLRSFLSV